MRAAQEWSQSREKSSAGTATTHRVATITSRLTAQAWDLGVVAVWAAFAASVGIGLRATGIGPSTPLALDVEAFLTLVLPVILTFAYQEGSARQATFGKRRMGAVVVDNHGGPPGFGRALVRSVVKFAPWQMAHTAVLHLLADDTASGYLVLSLGAQGLVLASVIVMLLDGRHRAFHDWVAGTRVVMLEA